MYQKKAFFYNFTRLILKNKIIFINIIDNLNSKINTHNQNTVYKSMPNTQYTNIHQTDIQKNPPTMKSPTLVPTPYS